MAAAPSERSKHHKLNFGVGVNKQVHSVSSKSNVGNPGDDELDEVEDSIDFVVVTHLKSINFHILDKSEFFF